jgi:hypothetical protein
MVELVVSESVKSMETYLKSMETGDLAENLLQVLRFSL